MKAWKMHVSFVMGKARVTPKKTVSIPRLELATISVNIGDLLKNELEYEDIKDYYWTDSKVVLGFISNESRRFHTYVANRVQLIHEHTTPSQWHYVETALNTADEGSRGRSPKDFVEKSEWIKGSDFLKEPVESWLKEETYEEHVDADSPEVKDFRVNASAVKDNSDILKRLQRFSSWHKVKVAVALCLRYKKKLRGKVLAKKKAPSDRASEERPINGTSISPGLNIVDLEEAEVEILKQVQVQVQISFIGLQTPFQANQTVLCLCIVVRELNVRTLKRERHFIMKVFKMNDTTLQTSIGLRIQHVLATLAVSGKNKSGQSEAS